jgi:hypothetical protein
MDIHPAMSLSITPPDTQNAEATMDHTLVDPLVAGTAQKLTNVVNDFKRQVKQRDGIEAIATGKLEFSFASQHFELAVDPGGDDTIAMHATLKPHNGHASTPPPPTHGPCAIQAHATRLRCRARARLRTTEEEEARRNWQYFQQRRRRAFDVAGH